MTIASGNLEAGVLADETVIVTGAGGGIGFEAARSLLWLGANVVVAEVDETAGHDAAARLVAEWDAEHVLFVHADVADDASVAELVRTVERRFGQIDVVLNNATFAPVGQSVAETPIESWDRSYGVNLRGPALLARACLPGMLERRHGIFIAVSSTGGPYLAAYESLKAAQLALANALDVELEGSGVFAFTIGPGLVPTATATTAIELLAPRLGMEVEEFWRVNQGAVLSVEAAGAGFAAAVALAERYAGQEISSTQALIDAGISVPAAALPAGGLTPNIWDVASVAALCRTVRNTLADQAAGWKKRSFFERQWMLREFKQRAGMPVEQWLEQLDRFIAKLEADDLDGAGVECPPLSKLVAFYDHLGELARGYVKDVVERDQQLAMVNGWKTEVERLAAMLDPR
jgi:NAD(P)-dependent dehydrogenase (short-subunit alcohol dehydrogenase family)